MIGKVILKSKVVKAKNYIGYYFYQIEILCKTLENIKPNILLIHINSMQNHTTSIQKIQEKFAITIYIYSTKTTKTPSLAGIQVLHGDERTILQKISVS